MLATKDNTQLEHCTCFLTLLAKIRINLESLNDLLPHLYEDYRFKASLNLLYRSISEDIITAMYLVGFVNLDDSKQISLNNELTIFHKEYLIGSLEGVKAEFEFDDLVSKYKNKPANIKPDILKEVMKENPELVNDDGKWKLNKEIRNTTHPAFIDLIHQDNVGRTGFISTEKKLEFIKNRGYESHSQLKALYKYFSQYQHYSPKVIDLVNSDIGYDILTYQNVIINILIMIDSLSDVIVYTGKDIIVKENEELLIFAMSSFYDEL